MRVKLLTSVRRAEGCYNLSLVRRLSLYAEGHDDLDIADEGPDAIHVFAPWSTQAVSQVQRLARRKLPVIFTSADGLQSLATLSTRSRKKLVELMGRHAALIHVGGPQEKALVEEFAPTAKVRLIANPGVTSLQTDERLCTDMIQLYREAISTHDAAIRTAIRERVGRLGESDPVLCTVCSLLLYDEYLVFRQTIAQADADQLSDALLSSQYDEDRLSDCLLQLGLHDFTASMMHSAATCSTLTEGFMPIPARADRQAERIVRLIQPAPQAPTTNNQ